MKFWRTPELVEKLLPLLDACSISQLAQLHQLTAGVLQVASFWNDLIRRSCHYDEHRPEEMRVESEFGDWVKEKFEEDKRVVTHLTTILKKMENSNVCLLQLLHLICERYPCMGKRWWDDEPISVQVSCPCKTSHSVSHLGFLLLEEIEGGLGSVEQKLEKVSIDCLQEPWLSAISSRASRQQERLKWWKMVERVGADRFMCYNRWDLKNSLSLMQNCHRMALEVMEVQGDLGAQGWASLARAFSLLQGVDHIQFMPTGRICSMPKGRI